MDMNLKGKNALVCGSTKGIGFEIAKQFAALGANVTLMARNGDLLSRVVRDLPSEDGQKHDFLVADFSKPEQVKEALEVKIQAHYSYQILVNNSG
ncbi:MAG: SDR family NAD(P)-dependent oxidoreductase, partial [Bacteroidia bacterium]|nr:SDR family NAD(P)-dependent oxidoreductase [Bacteroidia bacterium]